MHGLWQCSLAEGVARKKHLLSVLQVFCHAVSAPSAIALSKCKLAQQSAVTAFAVPCLQTGPPATQDINRLGLTCHTLAPDLLSAYNGDFGDLLRDEAAAALMSSRKDKGVANGYSLGANPILQAFAEVSNTSPLWPPDTQMSYHHGQHA